MCMLTKYTFSHPLPSACVDLEMLKSVGLAIAMGNALERSRGLRGMVVGTNHEAGVAQAAQRLPDDGK
jgi:hydroxymethylpyrimidine pyrophosphatase-like HAD family hydrolase